MLNTKPTETYDDCHGPLQGVSHSRLDDRHSNRDSRRSELLLNLIDTIVCKQKHLKIPRKTRLTISLSEEDCMNDIGW